MIMARTARYKLIKYDVREVPDPALQYVLYDMEADPAETRNLAADPAHGEVVQEHEAAIADFFKRLKPPIFPVRLAKDDPEADHRNAD